MVRFSSLALLLISLSFGQSRLATISGSVFLSDQTSDHGGVKVVFEAISSSATSDSTVSASNGSYSIGINDGIYTVHFSKTGYIPYTMPGTFSYAGGSYVQEDVTLAAGSVIEVSGRVGGTFYNDYQYRVVGDLTVDVGDTLIIEPGTSVLFMDSYMFYINGNIIAVGTEQDSIYITSGRAVKSATDWKGIRIGPTDNEQTASGRVASFQYCNIGYGGTENALIHDYYAFREDHWNAMDQDAPFLNIINCFLHNSSGRVIYSEYSRINLADSRITRYGSTPLNFSNSNGFKVLNNHIYWQSGSYDYASIYSINFSHANSYKGEIRNNIFYTNYYITWTYNTSDNNYSDSLIISNNYYSTNYHFYDNTYMTSQNNYTLIERNIFEGRGGNYQWGDGITAYSNDHSIIRNNLFNGLQTAFKSYSNIGTIFENNIINNCQNAFQADGSAEASTIQNNLIYNLSSDLIQNNNYNSYPVGLGEVMTVNTNGDSIDTYGNLYMNPKFAPSGSTVLYQWELDESGEMTFWANSGAQAQYFYDQIGSAVAGEINFYTGNNWVQLNIDRDFIPVNQTASFQRPISRLTVSDQAASDNAQIQNKDIELKKKKNKHRKPKTESGPSIQFYGIEEYAAITPSGKTAALFAERSLSHSSSIENSRSQDITISLTCDNWPGESSWNLYDYTNSSYYYASNQPFTSENQTITETLSLEDGLYSVDVWDSYGDGGVLGSVLDSDGSTLTSWAYNEYTDFGEYQFTVGSVSTGCTDSEAFNYDPDAVSDDGSCLYEGDLCSEAIAPVNGVNYADGYDEYYIYTATVDGGLIISSLSDTADWDTRLYIASSCENAENGNWIASSDDYDGTYASYLELPIEAGQDYYIYWSDDYAPGPFAWTLTEGTYSDIWTGSFDFYETFSDGQYPIYFYLYFANSNGNNSQLWVYDIDFISEPSHTEYAAYSDYLSADSPAIDAGNPAVELYDPDGTIADIGLHYYHQGDPGSIPAPTADFSVSSTSGSYPLYVEFTSVSSGAVTGYLWNFGDGNTSSSVRPVHLYSEEGTYSVSLTASGPGGDDTMIKSDHITVTAPSLPPVASFEGDPTTGILPLTVAFSSTVLNGIDSVVWSFGDGTTSNEMNPTHTYDAIGSYTVSLTAYNQYGADVATIDSYVNVLGPEAVIAEFVGAPLLGIAPLEVSFANESIGTIDSVNWSFGDGGGSNLFSPFYTYGSPGVYGVSMIAYGSVNNDTASAFDYIDVYDERPIITSVSDIPNDQGGQVLLRWNPSGWDGPVGQTITQYSLWEDYDGEWININNAMANQSDSYVFLASTFADSNVDGSHWSRFKVLAHTNDPSVYYESPVDSGYSVDNVPPQTPGAILATVSSNGIDLEWGEVTESNFMYYNLYRNGEKIAELIDVSYTDFNLDSQTPSYYIVTSVDDVGNESEPTAETIVDATDLDWYINIRGSLVSGETDLFNFIGSADDATAGFDEMYDIFEPPNPPGTYLSISYPHEDWDLELGDNFAQDIHKNIELADTMHVWDLDVVSNVTDSAVFYFDMSGLPNVPVMVEHIDSGERAYLADSSWFGLNLIADSVYSFRISIGDTTSPVLSLDENVNGPKILHSDSSYVFSWVVDDGNGIDSVFAYVSVDSGDTYEKVEEWAGHIDSVEWVIPDTTIATGCMIKIHARDYVGNHVTDFSDEVFAIVGDSLSVSLTSGWNLWGAPMTPVDSSMSDNLEEDIDGYWYTYGFEDNGYTFDSTLALGSGYWLATLDDATISVEGLPISDDYSHHLNMGWNLISNPLVLDVAVDSLVFEKDMEYKLFSEAVSAGWVNTIYAHDSLGYGIPTTIRPWAGYWISVLDTGISMTFPIHKGGNTTISRSNRDQSSWDISFEASTEQAVDRITVMGVAQDATDGFDPMHDIAEAPNPPGGNYVSMSVHHPDWSNVLGNRFAQDLKSPVEPGSYSEWTFKIESSSEEVLLSWVMSGLPDEYQVGYNYSDGFFFEDLRPVESITVPGNSELIVRVGMDVLGSIDNNVLPIVYKLHQNYPNPFNPTTSIKYDLPDQAHVEILIYDMLGRKVRTLVNQVQNAGYMSVNWNAANDVGEPVSAGVYIYTIEAGSYRETRKMIFLK